MTKIVGIDLGTMFSAVAHINDNGVPELIANEDGDRLTPSVILYDDGEFDVGMDAKRSAVAFPEDIVEFIKLEMGKPIPEFSREFGGKQYSPEELSAEILKTLKSDAEDALGRQVTDAVITVPAYFNDPKRQATIRAGEIAGLNVRRIINEPTAAALSYSMHLSGRTSTILVFDLGGGTFDVTIMEVKGEEMKVLVTGGDHRLGGKDWDEKIITHVAERFEMEHGENPSTNLAASHDLRERAVNAKIELSARSSTSLNINYAGKFIRFQLTRQEFEGMTTDLVERCRSLADVVLHEKGFVADQIDTVLMVGGSTRLPMIKNMLEEHFGKPSETSGSPDETVALGAAIMGELIESEELPRRSLPGRTRARNVGIKRFSDVCSYSLGMVALSESGELHNSVIIPKNTIIPCDVSKDNYRTTSHNQTEFDVIVLQGDLNPRECDVHKAYEFYDIPPRPAGETRIKVTFKYKTDGTIDVEAEDVETKNILSSKRKNGEIDWDALIAPKPVSVPRDIALVIDCSWSMNGEDIDEAKSAASRFLDNIDPSSQVGLVSFGNPEAYIQMELTHDYSQLRREIEKLEAYGTTPMTKAIALTRKQVLVNNQNTNVLILLTDGSPNNKDTTLTEAELAKQQGIRIIAIGVGDGVDSDYLKKVVSIPEDYYFVEESVQLESTFTTIASRLVTESSARATGITRH